MRLSSAYYPQFNGRAKCAVKAAKKIVYGNTTSNGNLDTDKFLQATFTYCNSTIYPERGKTIRQSLLGRNLLGALPAIREFYQLKKEHIMERKEHELVAGRRIKVVTEAYDQGSRPLPPLSIGDHMRVQNQTTTRTTNWDKTDVITAILGERKYKIMMDRSCHLTTRNRRHLRRIPSPEINLQKEKETE